MINNVTIVTFRAVCTLVILAVFAVTTTIARSQSSETVVLYMDPVVENLFLGGEPIAIQNLVTRIPAERGLKGFTIGVAFDPSVVSVDVAEGSLLASTGRPTICSSGRFSTTMVTLSCESSGDLTLPSGDGDLALLTITPNPTLHIRATHQNGIVSPIANVFSSIELIDGNDKKIPVADLFPAYLTVRALEGDVNVDCIVNIIDQQLMANRYLASIGSVTYDRRYDLEPSQGDGDIDIKDIQFVYGRKDSTCDDPLPPQPPQPPPVIPPTPRPTNTSTAVPPPTETQEPTPTVETTPTVESTPTAVATATNTPSITLSPTVTKTAVPTATSTPDATPTRFVDVLPGTPTNVPTPSQTPLPPPGLPDTGQQVEVAEGDTRLLIAIMFASGIVVLAAGALWLGRRSIRR